MRILLALAWVASAAGQVGDKEAALGERVASDIRKHTTPGAAAQYVRGLGERLKPPGTTWQFDVVRDDIGEPAHDAIAAPGGYVFVPEKLILAAGSEAELAAMLADAIARIIEHKPGTPWISSISAGVVSPHDRDLVLRADRRAVEMLATSGYDPAALLDYVKKNQPENPPAYSHLPPRAERVAAIQEALAAIPPRTEWIESSAAFVAAQDEVRRARPNRPAKPPSLFRPR